MITHAASPKTLLYCFIGPLPKVAFCYFLYKQYTPIIFKDTSMELRMYVKLLFLYGIIQSAINKAIKVDNSRIITPTVSLLKRILIIFTHFFLISNFVIYFIVFFLFYLRYIFYFIIAYIYYVYMNKM